MMRHTRVRFDENVIFISTKETKIVRDTVRFVHIIHINIILHSERYYSNVLQCFISGTFCKLFTITGHPARLPKYHEKVADGVKGLCQVDC